MKKLIALLSVLSSVVAFADLTTQRFGNMTYTTGFQNGQYVNVTSQQFGNQTFTSGTVGGQNVNGTSQTFGNQTFSNGNVGNQNYNSTSQTFGNQTFTNGRVGNSNFNTTSQTFGNQTFTSGSIDGEPINSTSSSFGGTTYTSGNVGNTRFTSTQQNFGNAKRRSTSFSTADFNSSSEDEETTDESYNRNVQHSQSYGNVPQPQNSRDKMWNQPMTLDEYRRKTMQPQGDDEENDPVLNTSVSSVFVSQNRIELESGDSIRFNGSSKRVVRDWESGDSVSVYEIKPNGRVVGYKLVNTDRNTWATGKLE